MTILACIKMCGKFGVLLFQLHYPKPDTTCVCNVHPPAHSCAISINGNDDTCIARYDKDGLLSEEQQDKALKEFAAKHPELMGKKK
jgi:hypothetical protein